MVIVVSMLAVPQVLREFNHYLNWENVNVANLLRFSIRKFPRLAVEKGFLFPGTAISFAMNLIINQFSPDTREAMQDPNAPSSKKWKLISLLLGTFMAGNLIAHQFFDASIYSNMGWEN